MCVHTPGPAAHNQCSKQYSPPRHLSSATADAWSAPPRLRNTLRYQTGFDHGHGLTNETNHSYMVMLGFFYLFFEIVSQAAATTT